nr:MAG: hypothetical protein [Betatorquevirus sp.]
MSKLYKPLNIGIKHRNLQWMNLQVGLHDMHCHCDNPLKHIILHIIEQEPDIKFNSEESKLIQKCLTTEDEDDGDVIGPGDLDTLFAEDVFGEEDANG